MCSLQSEDQLINILEQCFPKAHKFRIVETSTNDGNQSYVADIVRITFEFEEDGVQNSKSLILKVPKNTGSASVFHKLDFFTREILMYDAIIPRLNNYLDESLTPLCFKTMDSKIIILENLVIHGFEGGESNRQLYSLHQCLPILKALAYFHATSHKIGQTEPDRLQNEMFQNSTMLVFKKNTGDFWEPIHCELLARNNAACLIPKLKNVLLYLRENFDEFISRVHRSNFKFHVLNHGDFRKDNILLKYGPKNMVEGVKLIDFQTCFWSSPVYDFMYFFSISVEADLIENGFETLLSWYLECLNEKLKQMNYTQTYGKDNFMKDIKSLRIHSILNILFCSFVLCPLDRAQLADTLLNGKKDNNQYYMEACLKDELFTKTVLSNLKFFEKLRLFDP